MNWFFGNKEEKGEEIDPNMVTIERVIDQNDICYREHLMCTSIGAAHKWYEVVDQIHNMRYKIAMLIMMKCVFFPEQILINTDLKAEVDDENHTAAGSKMLYQLIKTHGYFVFDYTDCMLNGSRVIYNDYMIERVIETAKKLGFDHLLNDANVAEWEADLLDKIKEKRKDDDLTIDEEEEISKKADDLLREVAAEPNALSTALLFMQWAVNHTNFATPDNDAVEEREWD